MTVSPDLVVLFGPRGLLSLAGIVLIVGGVWRKCAGGGEPTDFYSPDGDFVMYNSCHTSPFLCSNLLSTLSSCLHEYGFLLLSGVDRSWDEMGSAAYKRALLNNNSTKEKKIPSSKTPLIGAPSSSSVDIPLKDLEDAFPFPTAFLIGWALFGVSFFSPMDGSNNFQVTWYALVAALLCLVLGWIASVPMGDAVMTRNGPKKSKLGLAFVSSWLLLTIFSGYGDDQLSTVHTLFRTVGAVCIIASMKILWKFRKMGDTWEQEGKPNPNPVVYNMGGPLFVFGWFLFWVGMAAQATTTDDTPFSTGAGIPIYLNIRSTVAFVSGCGMVPVVMCLDYAHDEGAEFLGFGTDGRYFGRFLESPVPFLLAWTFFGFSCWLPILDIGSLATTTTWLEWVILVNCIAQGIGKYYSYSQVD